MDSLDCPDASLLTPVRNVSMTALQALAVLNDPFVLKQAENFASRLEKGDDDITEQLKTGFRWALSRHPNNEELDHLVAFSRKHGLPNTCRLIFNMSEFMFVD